MDRQKRVLITGGGGYIGSAVVEKVLEKGHFPVVFDSFLWGRDSLSGLENRIELIEGDIRNSRDVIYALQDVDAVIHLAGIVGQPACTNNPLAHYTVNIESTRTLVDCMTDPMLRLVPDLIYCSSCSIYGNVAGLFEEVDENTPPMPLSEYADAKLKAEQIIFGKAEEVPHFFPTVLRLTTIFGWSRRMRLDLVTNLFAYKALRDGELTIFGDGSQYRSLIHVQDVADALVTALDAPRYLRDRQVFHVGEENNNVTVREIAEMVKDALPETKINFSGGADTDRRDYRIGCTKIKNGLNWKAKFSVRDGINDIIQNLKAGTIDPTDPKHRNDQTDYV